MRLRAARNGVGGGSPVCVSVLLFRGGGGGGKMAAHGGSAAASSALKGLIQQFTAITGKRRGYGKVKSGVRGGCRGCPGLHLTFLHSSLGLSPQLLPSPEEQTTTASGVCGSGGRQASPTPTRSCPRVPHSVSPSFPDRPPRPQPVQSRGWAEPVVPRAGDLRAGGVGGRTRATALFLLHHLLLLSCPPPTRRCSASPHAILSSRPGHRPSAPGLLFPSLGPPEPWRWPWRVRAVLL